MGQLERYGLYVLCLVIFLILGVAIWGDGAEPDPGSTTGLIQKQDKPLKTEEEKLDEFEKYLREQKRDTIEKQNVAEGLFTPADDVEQPIKKAQNAARTPPKKPAPPVQITHTVQQDETLAAISKRYLGKASLWRKILAINPGASERGLKVGMVLKIPVLEAARESSAPVAVQRTYTVQKGDSAWRIAAKHYGENKASEYAKRILRLNSIRDAGALKPGTKIALPR